MKKSFFFFLLLSLVLFLGSSGYFAYLVFVAPGDHLDLRKIQQSVLTESTVYYRDGRTKIGAMFSEARREYLVVPNQMTSSTHPDNIVPPLFLKAIIASEDRNFYDHIGVSVLGIFRAAVANFKAGRVVQGGSTLTQQTAELLFEHQATDRWGKWREKALETLDAFRLEARYSKDQILEFYANLFHVHGTGQGLAIAARYYFNKKVLDLDLPEIAFIAGSVKGPANYNPFRTSDPARKESILQKATERRNYVLNNMLLDGAISEEEFQQATQEPVQFRQGNFQFEANHLMDVVVQLLETEPLKSKLLEKGITNLKQAEASIYTTLDPNLQHVGEFALKQHLSDLEFRIKDYALPQDPPLSEKETPHAKEFYVGTILKTVKKPKPAVLVQVGSDEGQVAGEELKHFVTQVLRLKKKKANAAAYQKALQQLQPGDPILVSTHQKNPEGSWRLAIEQTPSLNGGVFIMQEGAVRGIVGGYHNHGFNRALQAKRQPGSTFKLPVYLAALQLGWSPLDALPNERRVYAFQGDFYFPRPDHPPQDDVASMVWAGAKSENLATVYLLVHLLDQLDLDQFTELMRFNGLIKQPKESHRKYRARLRRALGVADTKEDLMPEIFARVQQRLKNDFLTHAHWEEKQMWDRLFYDSGWEMGYEEHEKTQQKIQQKIELLEEALETPNQKPEKIAELKNVLEKSKKQREKLLGEQESLKHNFLRLEKIAATATEKIALLDSLFRANDVTALEALDPVLLEGFFIQPQKAGRLEVPPVAYKFVPTPPEEESEEGLQSDEKLPQEEAPAAQADSVLEGEPPDLWEPLTPEDFLQSDTELAKPWEPLTLEFLLEYHTLWNENLRRGLFRGNNVWLEGKTRLSMMSTARDMLQQLLEEMKPLKPYTPERLYYHRDFRTALALKTVIELSQTLGIRSKLRPVLSFPLGANEIALDELALMYHTLMTGQLIAEPENPHQNRWKLIDRIEDAKGDVIYQSEQIREQIIPPETVQALREILRSVVEYGTGINSKSALTLRGSKAIALRIPAYGKTGTANNYSNATYAGFLPTVQGGQTSMSGGYTITTYVGLDRQEATAQPLPFKLTGASGGLPVWAEVARYIIHTSAYRNKLDWTQVPANRRLPPPNAETYTQKVSLVTGLAVSPEQASDEKTAVVHLPPVPSKHARKALLFEKPLEMN